MVRGHTLRTIEHGVDNDSTDPEPTALNSHFKHQQKTKASMESVCSLQEDIV